MKKINALATFMLAAAISQAKAMLPTTTDFMNDQAVNLHYDYDNTYGKRAANYTADMQYLGFRFFRGPNAYGISPTHLKRLAPLFAAGIKMSATSFWQDAALGKPAGIRALVTAAQTINALGGLAAIEGQNECDGNPSSLKWNGLAGLPGCAAFQSDLYAAMKAALPAIPVWGPSLTNGGAAFASGVLDGIQDADIGHMYGAAVHYKLAIDNNIAKIIATGSHPIIFTESGYASYPAAGQQDFPFWVSETAEGTYGIDASFYAASLSPNGSRLRLVKYELYDEGADSSHESHFGMFHADGTPKPIAKAWHYVAGLMADPDPTHPTEAPAPTPSFTGLPSDASWTLWTSSTGYVITLTPNANIYRIIPNSTGTNGGYDRSDLAAPSIPVTLTLGGSYTNITVHDVVSRATTAAFTNTTGGSFSLHGPTVIKIAAAPRAGP